MSELPSAWRHYVVELAPQLFLGSAGNIFLSAWIFTKVQTDLSYSDALWHCWVTAYAVPRRPSPAQLIASLPSPRPRPSPHPPRPS